MSKPKKTPTPRAKRAKVVHKHATTRRLVNFTANDDDFMVAMLAAQGFGIEAIATMTNYTTSQVTYRLGLSKVKIREYRQGISQVAMMTIKLVQLKAAPHVRSMLKAGADKKYLTKA